MGKGKPINNKRKPDVDRLGCNCPSGCELNEPMPEPPFDNAIKMICSNDKCVINQNLHKQCYDNFETVLIRTIKSSMGRTRDWTDDQCRKAMWIRVYDMIYRNCKCICGGHLKKFEDVESPATLAYKPSDEGKKKKNKAGRQELPKLVLDKTKSVGYSASTVSKPVQAVSSQGLRAKSACYETKPIEINYIPGLVLKTEEKISKKPIDKNYQQLKAIVENTDDDKDFQVVGRNNSSVGKGASSIRKDVSLIAYHADFSIDKAFIYADIESALNKLAITVSSDKHAGAANEKNPLPLYYPKSNFDHFQKYFDNNFSQSRSNFI